MARKAKRVGLILKRIAIAAVVLVAGGAAIYYKVYARADDVKQEFTLGAVTQGDVENVVSCTGTLSAVGTVDVGAQVSGTIEKIYVDFNDTVTRGQVLARLDTSLFDTEVLTNSAAVSKAQAELKKAETEFERAGKLFEKGFVSESDFIIAETSLQIARAGLQSARASLKRARTNQKYTVIKSPIDGTVIERNIEEGQTIASSFSTPQLFIIAEDLSRMQIEASVDESDIGSVKVGQKARFTVQAYPDEAFEGAVRQIRLKPLTVQNVVNYTVVVDAANDEGRLMPGMTATVDFIIESRKDVLLVPNSAMSFKPSAGMLRPPGVPGGEGKRPGKGPGAPAGAAPAGGTGPDPSRKGGACVFVPDAAGLLTPACFVPGVSDGSVTEVTDSKNLREGTSVVTGTSGTADTKEDSEKKKGFNLPLPGMGKGGRPPRM
ncbi:MAG: efflux RND transporter periplasmic adaptor subunit [Pseudomonadota bacterium]